MKSETSNAVTKGTKMKYYINQSDVSALGNSATAQDMLNFVEWLENEGVTVIDSDIPSNLENREEQVIEQELIFERSIGNW